VLNSLAGVCVVCVCALTVLIGLLQATSEAVVREGTVAGKDAAAAIDETAVSAAILKNQHMV